VDDSFHCRFKTSIDRKRTIFEHFVPVLESVILGDKRACLFE